MTLEPWFVSGLAEGEGCFSVSFNWRARLNTHIEVRPSFSISLSARDLRLLQRLQAFFGCGGIRYSRNDRTYKYEVRSLEDLLEHILPHFDAYPLQGQKQEDYQKFKEICLQMKRNLHRSPTHLRKIVEIAYSMNPAGKRRIKKEDLLKVLGEMKG